MSPKSRPEGEYDSAQREGPSERVVTPAQLRELRARAHHLDPVVIVGQHGLTPSVLREIDVNLRAHELIKVRVVEGGREERDASLRRICAALGAAPVQHIGKLLVIWRPKPQPEPIRPVSSAQPAPSATRRRRAGGSGTGAETMAKSTPQARRPRSPLPRGDSRAAPRGRGDSRAAPRGRSDSATLRSRGTSGTSTRLAPASGRTPSAQARRRRRGGA